MKKILTILTLSAGLLAFPGTALADLNRAGADNSASNQSHEKHSLKADRNYHRKDSFRDKKQHAKKHADKKYLHKKYQHKKYQHKKYHAETIRQHKLARKHQDRVAAYRHFNSNEYSHWRDRRDYTRHLSYSDRRNDRERHSYRALRKHYYGHNHDRYRTHYLRYHQGHKRSHHQHDDSYLEWVTTMLLLNELLDDDYR